MVTSIDDNDNGQQTSSSRKTSAAWFIAANSPLSEHAVLGFGWIFREARMAANNMEAQFGDFSITAGDYRSVLLTGEERGQQKSNLVILLPHGYEGQLIPPPRI